MFEERRIKTGVMKYLQSTVIHIMYRTGTSECAARTLKTVQLCKLSSIVFRFEFSFVNQRSKVFTKFN